MSIYDKIGPEGTFRAPLAADWLDADRDKVIPVTLNGSGNVVKATNATHMGVVVVRGIQQPYLPGQTPVYRSPKATEIVDVMKRGEIVEVGADVVGAAAGAIINVQTADGAAGTGAGTRVGHMVSATRLVVNCTQ